MGLGYHMVVVRKNQKSTGGNFARGKKAVTIDDRTGFKRPYEDMVFEPGTNYWVDKDESDKDFSLVSHPQNYGPEPKIERISLRNPSPDTFLSIGAIVCIRDLFTNGGIYVTSAGAVSVGSGSSASIDEMWDFSVETNSMYVIQVF